ncbi:ATP-binding protein [Streptomyces sp. NPDC059897]|uniref:ATP-binding protein n=1 Tax=Streptomyces sp. NPDC059897 TaxID=3346994 RepID=UPI0036587EF8
MESSRHERTKGNLPCETTCFVGREDELSALQDLVSTHRLVTLTGPGGVGKSRLSRQVGADAQAAFPDGVWLVELYPIREEETIALALYEVLRLSDQSPRPTREVVAEWLADKRLLLILDCCEHLAAGCGDFVRALLAAAPGVHVLASSRIPLRTDGERTVAVPPLPVTTGTRRPGAVPADAELLFTLRAVETSPGAALAERDGAAVAAICARLEGIPLAVELAAARLPELSLAELDRRLHARFELLTRHDDPAGRGDERHRALLTTIGWSHELCTPLERLLWARLSVFVGGFEPDAARWVCAGGPLAGGQVAGLLDRLVDQSVLQRTDTDRGPRYSMLDTIREYGAAWLARLGEERPLRASHRDHYRRLARSGDRAWVGPEQVAWYGHLTAEHANLSAALEACLADPDPLPALEMAGELWFFWTGCGFLREGRGYLERALAEDRKAPEGPQLLRALWSCGHVATLQGDFTRSTALESLSLPMADRLADPVATAAVRYVRGTRLVMTGHPARTLDVCRASPPRPPASGSALAIWLLTRGITSYAHLQLGELTQAASAADVMREESELHGDLWLRAYARYFLAMAALADGDPAAALRHARDSLALKWQLHDTFGAAVDLDTMATSLAGSDPARAARLLGTADALWHSIGRDRAGVREFLATRHTCEHQLRTALGDARYGTAHREGLEADIDDGIGFALR